MIYCNISHYLLIAKLYQKAQVSILTGANNKILFKDSEKNMYYHIPDLSNT